MTDGSSPQRCAGCAATSVRCWLQITTTCSTSFARCTSGCVLLACSLSHTRAQRMRRCFRHFVGDMSKAVTTTRGAECAAELEKTLWSFHSARNRLAGPRLRAARDGRLTRAGRDELVWGTVEFDVRFQLVLDFLVANVERSIVDW